MNRIEERFARLKREGKKGFIVYIGAGDPNLDATRRLALGLRPGGRGRAGTGRAVQRSAGRRFGEPARRAARSGIRHHAAQSFGNRRRDPQALANSDCPLHLFQPDSPRRRGTIHQRRGEGGCGRFAGARFAAGRIGQLRIAHAQGRSCATFISSRRPRRKTAWNSS